MKVWIVSSMPYLEEFEKITKYWPRDSEYTVTPITNYGLGFSSVKRFLKTYKEVTPDVIMTDHGHIGFLAIALSSIIRRKKIKIFFFLRGNYWLERKNYSKNINQYKIEYFNIEIKTTENQVIKLFDANDKPVFYSSKKINQDMTSYSFTNIWPKNYLLKFNGKEIKLTLNKSERIAQPGVSISIKKIKESFERKSYDTLKERFRISVQKFGWHTTLKHSAMVISVCHYLEKEAQKYTKKPIVVCPIGIEPETLKSGSKLNLKHPSIVLIQNHQIKEKSDALISFKEVIKVLPEITFYISKGLPENRDNHNYEGVVDALSNFKNVIFDDILENNKFSYLKEADLYVLRSGLDCTPATIIEASMAGKVTIASKIGGIPEMIKEGETGFSIKNNNDKEWVKKIKLLIEDPEKRSKMGEKAKEHALKKYKMEKVAKDLFELITS